MRIGESDTPAPYETSRRSLLSHAPDGWVRTDTLPFQPTALEDSPGPPREIPDSLASERPSAANRDGTAPTGWQIMATAARGTTSSSTQIWPHPPLAEASAVAAEGHKRRTPALRASRR